MAGKSILDTGFSFDSPNWQQQRRDFQALADNEVAKDCEKTISIQLSYMREPHVALSVA